MTLDQYFQEIEYAVQECIKNGISSQQYVEQLISSEAEKADKIINIRKELLSPNDYEKIGGYLELGFFTEFDSKERIALFSFMFDIGKSLTVETLRERFRRYEINQKLFLSDATLFECIRKKSNGEKDFELIDTNSIKNVQNTEVFERNGFYYQVEPLLNPAIFSLCKENFKNSPIYIRLDPTKLYSSCPLFRINEAILIPANPNWWKNLNIHRRNKEGSSYILEPKKTPKDGYQEYWEYHVSGIRRLDVVAKRSGKGNLSMMIEELSDKASSSGITIGRCIHMDTDDEAGTPFNESILKHLDLAINVYEGAAANERYNGNLAKGQKVADATFRTHLLRIETLPFKSLLLFAMVFFESKTLLNDWFCDQFARNKMSNKTINAGR